MTQFTFGTDPEFFLTQNNRIVSAIGRVAQNRKTKHNIQGHLFYYDNVTAECAIKPATSKNEAIHHCREALTIYARLVYPCKLKLIPSWEFSAYELNHP